MTVCRIQDVDLFFMTSLERCLKPYQHDEYFFSFDFFKTKRTELFKVCSGSNGRVGVFVLQSLDSRKQISSLEKFSRSYK